VDVEWQGEDGETLARYEGPLITLALLEQADPSSVCLRFIDPWGDTTFNQQQLPILVQELDALRSKLPDGQRAAGDALLAFLRRGLDQVHTYIKFIGD